MSGMMTRYPLLRRNEVSFPIIALQCHVVSQQTNGTIFGQRCSAETQIIIITHLGTERHHVGIILDRTPRQGGPVVVYLGDLGHRSG